MKKLRYWQKPLSSTKEMRATLEKLSSTWTDEALLSKRMLLYACERLDEIAELLKVKHKKHPRKESAYTRFIHTGMKAGKSIQEVAREWQEHKRKTD